jgi:hypothetical protein
LARIEEASPALTVALLAVTTANRIVCFCFPSDHLLLSALTICQLYKKCWQVELFFKWIKQHLRIKRFYARSLVSCGT